MDYALAQHAEGNWLSNFEEPSPVGPLRVRQMAWWRSPALPASSMVIGNQVMDDKNFIFCLKSLIGTLPIVLGDPRKLTQEKRNEIKSWSVWMQEMQRKYDYLAYRRDLPGFGEPREGAWDGWQRINFQTQKGGIFGVFRQGALETTRTVFLNDLLPDKTISFGLLQMVALFISQTEMTSCKKGFTIALHGKYDGEIYRSALNKVA
jgi:alpha-galactosidase